MTQTPAGWYPQPDGNLRYWDGAAWTDHIQPATVPGPPQVSNPPVHSGAAYAPPTATLGSPAAGAAPRKIWFARHKILTGLLVLFGIGVVGSAIGGNKAAPTATVSDVVTSAPSSTASAAVQPAKPAASPKSSTPAKVAAPKPAAPAGPGLGTSVRDGKFEFVVTKVKKGVSRVGGEYANEKAQGQFVLVYVKVTNIGEEPQTLLDSEQKLRDSRGREFSTNSVASLYIDDNDVLFNEINPGNSVKGVLVYDMPKNSSPASIEVHDSFLSDGVVVRLT